MSRNFFRAMTPEDAAAVAEPEPKIFANRHVCERMGHEGIMSRIFFRAMTPDDAAAVAELELKIFAMPWSREDFFREMSNELAVYIVGELDGRIVAYAGAWVSFNQAEVMHVAVDSTLRGQGVGTLLFGELLGAVKARGATAVTLEVRPSNTAAIKLYENFGLHSVGRRKGYYLDNGEDALIMWNTKL